MHQNHLRLPPPVPINLSPTISMYQNLIDSAHCEARVGAWSKDPLLRSSPLFSALKYHTLVLGRIPPPFRRGAFTGHGTSSFPTLSLSVFRKALTDSSSLCGSILRQNQGITHATAVSPRVSGSIITEHGGGVHFRVQ